MKEKWDIYNEEKRQTGKKCFRDVRKLKSGEYHLVVTAIILNENNEILISKRAGYKTHPNMWECCGGSVKSGESSLEGMLREIKEELGIVFNKREAMYLKTIKSEENHDFKDLWVFKRNIKDNEITKPDGEVIDTKWVKIEEFNKMLNNNEFVPTIDFNEDLYNRVIILKPNLNYEYIGKIVDIEIDRPLGSRHPKYKDFIYPINYGFVPNTVSGDGKELDCYIIDLDKKVQKVSGKCIGIIQRINDEDDKLIVVDINNNKKYTEDDIIKIVNFAEKYFSSMIILI